MKHSMNTLELKSYLSQNKDALAVTAPFMLSNNIFIGFHTSSGGSFLVGITHDDLSQIAELLYMPKAFPIIVHGLKRIWEFLDVSVEDLDTKLITDTKLIAYLLDPDAGRGDGLTLTHLANQYLAKDYPHFAVEVQAKGPRPALHDLLMSDAQTIWELGQELPRLMSKELLKLYRDMELPLTPVLYRMHKTGIGIDPVAAEQERMSLSRDIAELQQRLTGGEAINVMSPTEVYHFLVRLGVQFEDPARAYAAQKAKTRLLEGMAHLYPVIQDVLDLRSMIQDLSVLNEAIKQDRAHPMWQQTRSGTSRIYAREPAVQNISRNLRERIFVPHTGSVFIKADYSQAQLRILAHLSGDKALIDLFNRGGDVHTETAQLLGIDRNAAKEVNFGICFGISAAGLAGKINAVISKENLGKPLQTPKAPIDESQAQAYIDAFYSRYPGVREFLEREWERLTVLPMNQRMVRSLLGRIRRFDTRANPATQRSFRVTWPQQIEADLIKTAMVRLDRIFYRRNMLSHIVMVIHDALWVEAPQDEAEEVRSLMRKMMTKAAKLVVPLDIDAK
jgi:DNA polymerase I